MEKKRLFILTKNAASPWVTAVTDAVQSLGDLSVFSEEHIWSVLAAAPPDLLLLDASGFAQDVVNLVEQLHQQQSNMPIIVVSTSPTWQHARAVLMAGATDYIRHSFDAEQIRETCREAMKLDA
ncbi:MAG: response regulator [Anaerolineae bacterium]|nr:response regulator [Anaerolineae bacterium]